MNNKVMMEILMALVLGILLGHYAKLPLPVLKMNKVPVPATAMKEGFRRRRI